MMTRIKKVKHIERSAADSGFSPPLCFVEKPLPALRGNCLTPAFPPRSTPLRSAIAHDLRPRADGFPLPFRSTQLKRRRQAQPCGVSANWHGKMLMLPFPAPACPHTAPTLAGDCGKSPLPGIRLKPVRADLPQTPGRIKTTALRG